MKVFSAYDDVKGRNGVTNGSKTAKPAPGKKELPPVKEVSKEEVRAKVTELDEAKVSSKASKTKEKIEKVVKEQSSIFNLNKEKEQEVAEEASVKKVTLPKSDIAKNDPGDPVTKEKLKSALSSGAISFNPGERKALQAILAEE